MLTAAQFEALRVDIDQRAVKAVMQVASLGWRVTIAAEEDSLFSVYAFKKLADIPTIVAIVSTIPMHTNQLKWARKLMGFCKLSEMVFRAEANTIEAERLVDEV